MKYSMTVTFSDELVELLASALSPRAASPSSEDTFTLTPPGVTVQDAIPTDEEARRKLWLLLEEEFDPVEAESRRDLKVEGETYAEALLSKPATKGTTTHVVRARKVHTRKTYEPEEKREALRLRLVEGWEYKDIEELTGVNKSSVAMWVSRLRKGETISLGRRTDKQAYTLRRADFDVFTSAREQVRSGTTPRSSSTGERS